MIKMDLSYLKHFHGRLVLGQTLNYKAATMDNVTTPATLGLTLKSLIDGHLSAHPNVSLRGLASREEGMGREYLRRLAAGEIPDHKLDKDKVLLLLMTISKKRTINELIAHFGDPIAKWLLEMFPIVAASNTQLIQEDLDAILCKADDECVAYYLARSSAGVSPDTTREILGNAGVEALKVLESKGHLTQKGGKFFGSNDSIFTSSIASWKNVAKTFLNFYRPSHFGRKRNYMMILTASLNQKGIEAEQELYRKFHQDLSKLYSDKENHGDIHCFAVACMDSFNVLEEARHELH